MGLGCMAQISALDEVRGCRRCEDDDRLVPLFILWAYPDPCKVASVRNGVFGRYEDNGYWSFIRNHLLQTRNDPSLASFGSRILLRWWEF